MLPSPLPQLNSEHLNLAPKILESRSQYHSCHILLPGEDRRIAAVRVDGKYYSLSRVVKNSEKAREVCARLASKGHETVITQLAKGHAIWRYEPEAYIDPTIDSIESKQTDLLCNILESRDQYQFCHIRVPDLEKRLAAIFVNDRHYGLFKVVETQQQALAIVAKLKPRKDEIVITQIDQETAIWILEPDAELDQSPS